MPTEREVIRKFLRSGTPMAERLIQGAMKGEIRVTDDVVDLDEELTILAGDDHGGIIGAKGANCAGCGTKVWLSPSTLEMMAKRGNRPNRIVCFRCVLKEAKV